MCVINGLVIRTWISTRILSLSSGQLQEMLAKSREDDSGVKLEVNERILDSCTGLMKTIKTLIIRARDLQGEIISEGMVCVHSVSIIPSLFFYC